MSLIQLQYLAEKLPEKFTYQDIIEHCDCPQIYKDKNNVWHGVFDGEDERADFFIFLLELAKQYAEYLSVRGETREHDYWKDGLLAHSVANSFEGWNYNNATYRIQEVIQQVNRNNSYINDYYMPKYEEEIDGKDSE